MRSPLSQGGALMIEVLVTIVILAIGLLGLMQMQSRLQQSEMESYQRTQAIMLMEDMANRLAANRANAADYIIGDAVTATWTGEGVTCPTADASQQERDVADWCNALQGAGESLGGADVGALVRGRGCIYQRAGGAEYQVTVVWQGLAPVSAPPVICGKDDPNPYDGSSPGADCVDDLCRRAVTTVVRIGNLPP